MDANDLNEFDRGELDCLYGYEALEGQSESYYAGYGEQYAKEQAMGGASGH
jgi:hypothetical protein